MIPNRNDVGLNVMGRHIYFGLDNRTMNSLLGKCASIVLILMGREAAERLVNASLNEEFLLRWTAVAWWCSGL